MNELAKALYNEACLREPFGSALPPYEDLKEWQKAYWLHKAKDFNPFFRAIGQSKC